MAAFKSSARHCCVPECVSDDRYDENISFHTFPKDLILKKEWIVKIRRDEGPYFKITDSTVVCLRHFKKDDYKWTPLRKTLKKGVVPSVFAWTGQQRQRRKIHRKILAEPKETKTQIEIPDVQEHGAGVTAGTQESEPMEVQEAPQINYQQLYEEKTQECERLQLQMAMERFGVSRFSKDDNLISFYTGFSSYISFLAFFNCIKPTAQNMQSAYYRSSDTVSLAGRKRSMFFYVPL